MHIFHHPQVVQQYDLILIIELVDVSQTVWPGFVAQLNWYVAWGGGGGGTI